MADNTSEKPGPFDAATVQGLVELMSQHDLGEIYLRQGEQVIRLRRGTSATAVPPAPPPVPVLSPTPAAAAATPAAPEADKPSRPLHLIKAPTPGTFYTAANPGAEPFVRVGTRVTPTTVVGIIEAMKIFNEIPADCAGVIVEALIENQQPVEYGQVLFKVDPAG